jgi:glycosyltransferase involved in cell wall biosynthesis
VKLVLFTPTDRRSAIGRVSTELAAAWKDFGHDLVIISTDEQVPSLEHSFNGLRVIRWDEAGAIDAVLSADTTVHQIGNSFTFHIGSVEWLQRVRGVVILHDFYLTNLFLGWCRYPGALPGVEASTLTRWYGDDAPRRMADAEASRRFLDDTADWAPMTEWLCARSLGVVTHSRWGLERVHQSTIGPVVVARMPYPPVKSRSGGHWPRDAGTSEFNLLTFGMINSNRQVPEVIAAIARSSVLRTRVTYHLLGGIVPSLAFEYARQARVAGVRLQIHGTVDNRTLADAVGSADAIVALRRPCTEAASASVLEAFHAARPTIVNDAGSSAEFPDDITIKVGYSDRPEALTEAIERLVANPEAAQRMGDAALAYVQANHGMPDYAAAVLEVCHAAVRLGLHAATLDDAVSVLAGWGLTDDRFDEFALAPIREFWPEKEVVTDDDVT